MFRRENCCQKKPVFRETGCHWIQKRKLKTVSFVCFFVVFSISVSRADIPTLPFEVTNLSHAKWSPEEAVRIYDAACALVARSVNADRPPHLHPKFLLVLGGTADEIVRTDNRSEIHLKTWNADKFAEATAIMAARDLVQGSELRSIAHQSVVTAHATASVVELRGRQ